jgi:LPXTG-motif cell wall-anchored protein
VKASTAKAVKALADSDDSNDLDDFAYWSKKNTLDVSVTAPAVQGGVGDTVTVAYEVVNHGPSDGGGPSVVITAPSGTVLLAPADWCYTDGTPGTLLPESTKLRCDFESLFPATASGFGKIRSTVRVKIKSAPGKDGTIVAKSVGLASAESKPSNNTVRIVISSSGGSGGGLPVTGAPAGTLIGVGAGVVLFGLVALVLVRRRRVVLELPRS